MTSKAFGLAQLGNAYADGALSNRNKIINGAMTIDQRNAGAAVTASGSFVVDRFSMINTSDGAFSAQQVSEAPSGFTKSVKVTATTADATLATTQNLHLRHAVEGFNVADLGWGTAAAQAITISFWARSSLTGTFGGSLRNSASTRAYAFTYSISAANTWEYKTVTIAGDTSGTWETTNGVGILVSWGLGAGPDRSGTAGVWTGDIYVSATGAVSLIGTLNATWQITGVQLEAGDTATPFEHRSYGQELALCQRYFQTLGGVTYTRFFSGFCPSTTEAVFSFVFPTPMRTAPTASASGTIAVYHGAYVVSTTTSIGFSDVTNSSIACSGFSSGLTTNCGALLLTNNDASARITFSAEL